MKIKLSRSPAPTSRQGDLVAAVKPLDFAAPEMVVSRPARKDPKDKNDPKGDHQRDPSRPAEELLHLLQVHQIELEMQNDALRQSQIELGKSRDRYIEFYDFAPVGYLTLNDKCLISEINLTGAALLGADRSKLVRRRFSPYVAPEELHRWRHHFLQMISEDEKQSCEVTLQRADQSRITVQMDSLRLVKGDQVFTTIVLIDITERKRLDVELRIAATAFESSESMVITGADSVILKVNHAFTVLTGYTAEEAIGGKMSMLSMDREDSSFYTEMRQSVRDTGAWQGEIWNQRKNGETTPLWLTITAVTASAGEITHFVGTLTDISALVKERAKMREELTTYQRSLDAVSLRMISVQEEIKRRLSGELHDRTSPNLAAIELDLSLIAAALPTELSDDLIMRLADTRALLEDTEASIREICGELRPAVLDYAGLVPALEGYASQFAKRTGMVVKVNCDIDRLSPEVESLLFRICQEAMTNSAKHSKANRITVGLSGAYPVTLTVTDDGVGFDLAALNAETPINGLGLLNMREITEISGGKFNIKSTPGAGTRIQIEI